MPLSKIVTGQFMSFFLVTMLNVVCIAVTYFWHKYPNAMLIASICFASAVGIGFAYELTKEEKDEKNANS